MSDLLSIESLSVRFGRGRTAFEAVRDVSLTVDPGETVAIVGESGAGKSTVGNAVLGLAPVSSGRILFQGADIAHASRHDRRALAKDLQVVFQNPYGSLNPSLRIGQILTEPLIQEGMRRNVSREVVGSLLERVGLPPDAQDRFPRSFSGGQRQRIALARAVARRPCLIVCDEPTSALDVSTQSIVLDLLTQQREETGVAYLFITHDLAVVRHFADRVVVMRRGSVIETGTAREVCETPQAEYTQRLVAAAPVPDPIVQAARRQARCQSAGPGKDD